jgi:hypothetical protein
VTIFYGLRFEISVFVASYDPQVHGEGSRTRLDTRVRVKVKVTLRLTVSQSVSPVFVGRPLSDERTVLSFVYASGPRQRSFSRVLVPWDS